MDLHHIAVIRAIRQMTATNDGRAENRFKGPADLSSQLVQLPQRRLAR